MLEKVLWLLLLSPDETPKPAPPIDPLQGLLFGLLFNILAFGGLILIGTLHEVANHLRRRARKRERLRRLASRQHKLTD